ncbi:proenkephalin-A-like [Denticeps clupeoides]|uniref:Synenkephalin n=1 Tax=Denticeps clupeoides TaxID=299321 RepID=A0AAY4APL3_9TELE|nr:proenkephalin-A-like [Denticeps clupeoides]
MALLMAALFWPLLLLLLGPWRALTVRADCGTECARCLSRPLGRDADGDAAGCTLECKGTVNTRMMELCRDLSPEEDKLPVGNVLDQEKEGDAAPQHKLDKKYGGFMKRFGSFVMKKAAEIGGSDAPADAEGAVQASKRYGGFMKKKDAGSDHEDDRQLQVLREFLSGGLAAETSGQRNGEVTKRYGGFMKSLQEGQEGEEGRDLQKRYGGFMRRVGRPEWLDDPKTYNEMLKRSWGEREESSVPQMEKRYGGFMD